MINRLSHWHVARHTATASASATVTTAAEAKAKARLKSQDSSEDVFGEKGKKKKK